MIFKNINISRLFLIQIAHVRALLQKINSTKDQLVGSTKDQRLQKTNPTKDQRLQKTNDYKKIVELKGL